MNIKNPTCIVCTKVMGTFDDVGVVISHKFDNHECIPMVDDGLVCRATGNFGSTIYDPSGHREEFLQFYICDDCMVSRSHLVERFEIETERIITKRKTFRQHLDEHPLGSYHKGG